MRLLLRFFVCRGLVCIVIQLNFKVDMEVFMLNFYLCDIKGGKTGLVKSHKRIYEPSKAAKV
ncbi:hypothetical protein J2Z26_000428 [Bacillus luteolus]|nr:hypothetical protein [Cytobacillus luteolus]